MSNKGAIRKTSSNDMVKGSSKQNSKNKDDDEYVRKSDALHAKKSYNHRGEGDKPQRGTPNSIPPRLLRSKTSTKESGKSQIKTRKDLTTTGTMKSSSSSNINVKSSTSSRLKTDVSKRSSTTVIANSKPKEKVQPGYAEKRGLSTVYIPQSIASKLKPKTTTQPSPTSKDKSRTKDVKESVTRGKVLPRERKLSRTLSPSEIKMLHLAARPDTLQISRKHKDDSDVTVDAGDYDYADDFEDYESDFQECTDSDEADVSEKSDSYLQEEPIELCSQEKRKSVHSAEQRGEEEHMLDSGHYELAEARKRAARIESIITSQPKYSSPLEAGQSTNKPYSEDKTSEIKSLPSSTDEGFEDSRSGDFTRSPPLSQISIIDFRKSKGNQPAKKTQQVPSRGQDLLQMIKLDTMQWSLLECTPIPYDDFIKSYGKLNSQQVSTQTGEDNTETETQTDAITLENKWTQFPVACRTNLRTKDDVELFKMDQLGVGGDQMKPVNPGTAIFDVLRLSDFVTRAGRVILSLLEEKRQGTNIVRDEGHNSLAFSSNVVRLAVNKITFLAGRPVTIIHYSETFNKILLTIHASAEEEIETSSKQDFITDCSIGCVWNISEPSMPTKLFYTSCPISACCFHSMNYNVVFAGLLDGSMSLWDLKEDEMYHQKITDKANEVEWTIRTPTYTTTGSDVMGHQSKIVAVRILSKVEDRPPKGRSSKFVPIQICSLDDEGLLIIWSAIHNVRIGLDDLGLSYWGDIKLAKTQELLLKSDRRQKKTNALSFIDMCVNPVNTNNLYVATNTSSIVHATCIGHKSNPPVYDEAEIQPSENVTCMEICPFERSFFWAGCDDGSIRLHSSNSEKPILRLRDESAGGRIKAIKWSKSKPFTVYVLHSTSLISIWDLSKSDIQSSHTIDMRERGSVTAMDLSPCKTKRDMNHQYLALGTEVGTVEVHKLQKDFCHLKLEDSARELDTFLRYIAIL